MRRFLLKHWFLVALAICLVIGFGIPGPFSGIANSSSFRSGVVVVVMVLMGWTLQPKSIARSIRNPLASLLAITINVVGVPLLALPSLWFLPAELAGGLVVASLIPCTLASASVWTRAAGGDDAVAMMTTVVTNLACFVVAPIGLAMTLGQTVQINIGDQMRGLLWQVVLPLVAGQGLRQLGWAKFADTNKSGISNTAQIGILLMVLLGAVIAAERMAVATAIGFGPWLLTLVYAAGVHTAALAIGYFSAPLFGIARPQQLGIAIAGSQKTLMVGLQLALASGVSVLPMVMYHVSQLLIDTVIVRRWNQDAESTTI